MIDYNPINSVADPRNFANPARNNMHIKAIFDKLSEIERKFPNKKYASIFYERYAKGCDNEAICKHHNINERELNSRLLEIADYISKSCY